MPNTKPLINRSLSIVLTAQVCILVTALTAHDGWAQNSPQSGCDGVECMDASLAGDLTRVEALIGAGASVQFQI